jgi:small subunit ribosomal protein S17
MKKTKIDSKAEKEKEIAEAKCNDRNCHIHGNLKTRGRVFKGKVIKKFPKRVVIEFERMIYIKKYERYQKGKTKIHARLPSCMEAEIQVGDYIKVQECRPLSKLVHFVVLGKVKDASESKEEGKQ